MSLKSLITQKHAYQNYHQQHLHLQFFPRLFLPLLLVLLVLLFLLLHCSCDLLNWHEEKCFTDMLIWEIHLQNNQYVIKLVKFTTFLKPVDILFTSFHSFFCNYQSSLWVCNTYYVVVADNCGCKKVKEWFVCERIWVN